MTSELRKAAVLLVSLPREQAAAMLAQLEPRQVESVVLEIARCDEILPDERQAVLRELAGGQSYPDGNGRGGAAAAEDMVERAFGKGKPASEAIRHAIQARPFHFLRDIDSHSLLTFLRDEHPQTMALVLAYLSPEVAAKVLSGLAPEVQIEVVRRIAALEQANVEVVVDVARGLEQRIARLSGQRFKPAGGADAVAKILNVADRPTERGVLERLVEDDPGLADEIRRLMFVFEDLNNFSNKDVQTVLKNVDTSQLALALKGASEALRQKVLGNMSKRASDVLREEMDYLGPVRTSSVAEVQQQIVDLIRRLEDAGQVNVDARDEAPEFIE